jgi:glycosyltransferase involved in cell wall biosynthesis
LLFYQIPRVILAPNEDLMALLAARTRKPTFLMSRGVDTERFTPAKRSRSDSGVNIGYVGRLSPEKSVRLLARVDRRLRAAGFAGFRFTIVGDGSEREWLSRHLPDATFTGVLHGETLASAFADMDLFVFPSETETVGNVVLEAMASGVPVVAMARGGPKYLVGSSSAAVLAGDERELAETVCALVRDVGRRESMSAAGRAHAMARSWDAIFDEVYRAYAVAVSLTASSLPGPGEAPVGERRCAEV